VIESCRDHNGQSGIGFDPLARNVLEFSDHNDWKLAAVALAVHRTPANLQNKCDFGKWKMRFSIGGAVAACDALFASCVGIKRGLR
jgi:hypothetical protein